MPEHSAGTETVSVAPRARNFWIYRRQGIRIEISPDRKFWCLWLCSSTTSIDRIRCSITLSGDVPEADASGQCTDCGSLNVMEPAYWGANFPPPFAQVTYRGTVVVDRQTYPISGTIVYSK